MAKGVFYTPQPIKPVPGLVVKRRDAARDAYIGTADMLVASGVIPRELLPGQPGRASVSASYRPAGIKPGPNNQGWHCKPGYLAVTRGADDRFTATVVVSLEERQLREAEEKQRMDHAQGVYRAALAVAAQSRILQRDAERQDRVTSEAIPPIRLVPTQPVAPQADKRMIERLGDMLSMARSGELRGWAAVAYMGENKFFVDACGWPEDFPHSARGHVLALDDELRELARERDGD